MRPQRHAVYLGMALCMSASVLASQYPVSPRAAGVWSEPTTWPLGKVPSNGLDYDEDGTGDSFHIIVANVSGLPITLTSNMEPWIDAITTSPGNVLAIDNGWNIPLITGGVTNDGRLELNSINTWTGLLLYADTQLSGSGVLAMSDSGYNNISGSVRVTVGAAQTLRGAGSINTGLTNGGLIEASWPNNPLIVNPGSFGAINAGILQASGGGTLRLTNGLIDNSAGRVIALDGSAVQVWAGVSLEGGTLESAGSGYISGTAGQIRNITNLAKLRILNGDALIIKDVIQNEGQISMEAAGYWPTLYVAGAASIQGAGVLTFTDDFRNTIRGVNPMDRLTNPAGNTLRLQGGRCGLGNNGLCISNLGDLVADATLALIVDPTDGGDLTNTGTLKAMNGGVLQLAAGSYLNAGGMIVAADNSRVELQSSANVQGGTLSTQGNGLILGHYGWLRGVTNEGTIRIPSSGGLHLAESFTNEGRLELDSVDWWLDLYLYDTVRMEGSGLISLGADSRNMIRGTGSAGRLLNPAGSTLRIQGGRGNLGSNSLRLTNEGTLVADANLLLAIDPSDDADVINTGTIRAENGARLQLIYGSYDNTGGTIVAGHGSTIDLTSGANISNGVLTSEGSGAIAGGWGQIRQLTNMGTLRLADSRLYIKDVIVNEGVISLDSAGGWTELYLNGPASLAGSGVMTLSSVGNNVVVGVSSGDVLTVPAGETLRVRGGRGNLGGNRMGLVNAGSLNADATALLTLDVSDDGGLTNTGLLQATNGSVLRLESGPINNAGGQIVAGHDSVIELGAAPAVTGGTLNTVGTGQIRGVGGTLKNLTNAGQLVVPDGNKLSIEGTLANSGTLAMNSAGGWTDLRIISSVQLAGGGSTVLSNDAHNRVYAETSAAQLTVAAGHTLRGAGTVGYSDMGIVNDGTILADQPLQLGLDASDAGFFNHGLLRATGAAGLGIWPGPFTNDGTVEAAAGSIVYRSGEYVQTAGMTMAHGTLTATDGVNIQGGALIGVGTVNGSVINSGMVGPGGSVGTLTINGNYTQTAAGSLAIELGGAAPGSGHDVLAVSATVALGGDVHVTIVHGFMPQVGQEFTIVTGAAVSGNATVSGIGEYELIYSPTTVALKVLVPCGGRLRADLDEDCDVDSQDLAKLVACQTGPGLSYQMNLPGACTLARDGHGYIPADLNRDWSVDSADFGMLQRCYADPGETPGPGCTW